LNTVIICAVLVASPIVACDNSYDTAWDKSTVEFVAQIGPGGQLGTVGTGFLVVAYDSTSRQFLVTCRHILVAASNLYIRFNVQTDHGLVADTIAIRDLVSAGDKVIFPKDSTLDLAVLTLPMNPDRWRALAHPKSMFANGPELGRGTEIYFLGFPNGVSYPKYSIPVYRHGVIALDKEHGAGSYFIDATVIGGSSGSPAFTCDGMFIGVVRGYLNSSTHNDNGPEVVGPGVSIEAEVITNSGLGDMIPVERVVDFLKEISPGWRSTQ
jgi:S1-C subfamily serine protease